MNNYNNYEFGDVLNAISIILGWTNLQENRQQSAYNDVHKANDEQAKIILNEINARFDEQNKILAKQNEILAILGVKLGIENIRDII